MAGHGREESRNRKRAEVRKKIDDQTKIAEELQKEVDQGSLQFKELLTRARDLRRVFDELDNEHAERESTGVPGHVKDNAEWDQARNRLHQVYRSIRSYLEENAPPDEGIKLAPVEPKRLKTKEPSTKQKGKDGEGSKKKKGEEKSQVSATSARSVLPANPTQLKQFLESKDLNFKEKLISLKKETNETKREALAQVLIKWLSRLNELETAVRDTREQITEETELAAYDEAWADLSATITKARKKVKEFVEPPSSEDKDDAKESVTSWVERSVAGSEDDGRQRHGRRGSFRGSQKKRRSSSHRQRRSPSSHSQCGRANEKGLKTSFQGFSKKRESSNRRRREPSPFEWPNNESSRHGKR
jgi:hypothetical protein